MKTKVFGILNYLNKVKGEIMGKKEAQEKITIDSRLESLKNQQKELSRLFDKIQGAIEVLEEIKREDNEKTD